ncbi:Acylaminoacyl-peptidase [Wenzhouxiangella marina]|uniref:Acylaminoacyl-peptidase n=2 Tax=Wenzhouxiangella marina TaxID=1579979 RepID=A0A0K0XSJ3_9GAMM|nr:Acylaminoacyl-peptidase [Wenzhouxiangella marina]
MTTSFKLPIAPVLVLAGLLALSPLAQGRAPLALDDVFDLELAGDPRPSPDGERIVFERIWMDRQSDRARSMLWIMDADGSDLEPLTSRDRSVSSPRWSPDGTRLAYTSGGQIFVRWMDSGREVRLADLPRGASNLIWSPDGRWLAFVMHTPEADGLPVQLPGRPQGADWAPDPIYIDRLFYRADGAGYVDAGWRHVYLLPAEGGSPSQLTEGPYHHGDLSWSPDGQALLLTANRSGNAEREPQISDIYRLDLATRELERLNMERGPHARPRLSPDGRSLAWLGFEDRKLSYQANRLYVRELDGGEIRNLTEDLDRGIDDFAWDPDGRSLLIAYDHEGRGLLARQRLNGRREVLTDTLGGMSYGRPYSGGDFSVGASGLIAFTHLSSERPAEVAVLERNRVRVLTELNRDFLADHELGEVEEFWYESSVDGRRLQGWIIHPPGFDPSQRWPLILEIHGGPHTTYGPGFAMELQLMAARGYVVLYTNPRGSTSYGEDFANLIHHDYPSEDYNDLIDGVDAVIERGYVDPEQLYVTGGSGGGVLTAWIVGQTDRFRAAVSVKPVINWYSFVLSADAYAYFTEYWFPGPPWEHQEHYMARSPISLVGNVTTPTMLMTGEADYRTPISETEQYYQALKLRGIDTAMVRIPEAPHAIYRRPSNLMAKVAYILYWFEEHAGEDTGSEDQG